MTIKNRISGNPTSAGNRDLHNVNNERVGAVDEKEDKNRRHIRRQPQQSTSSSSSKNPGTINKSYTHSDGEECGIDDSTNSKVRASSVSNPNSSSTTPQKRVRRTSSRVSREDYFLENIVINNTSNNNNGLINGQLNYRNYQSINPSEVTNFKYVSSGNESDADDEFNASSAVNCRNNLPASSAKFPGNGIVNKSSLIINSNGTTCGVSTLPTGSSVEAAAEGGGNQSAASGNNYQANNQPTRSRHGSNIIRMTLSKATLEWNDFSAKFGKCDLGHEIDYSSRIALSAGKSVSKFNICHFLINLFPIIKWIRNYDVKTCLLNDIITGFTIAVLHIPQGMAYGLLAGVGTHHGLYVSLFPVIIYAFMGTSKHVSLGTSAMISIMIHNAIGKLSDQTCIRNGTEYNCDTLNDFGKVDGDPLTMIDGATTICLLTGFIMVGMGLLHLGSLSLVLSDQIVSAFVCGSAFQVTTSQMTNFLGLDFKAPTGPFGLIKTWYNLFKVIHTLNYVTIIVSLSSMAVLITMKDFVEPKIKAKYKFNIPIPTDLIVIVVATSLSYALGLHDNHKIKIIGKIPTGIPTPAVPRLDVWNEFITDSIAIAVVSFAVCLSLGKIYAKEHKYKVIPNQELIAMGSANMFSSFFYCFPCSTSLSRTAVQSRVGGKTQLVSLFSCTLLFLVLYFLAPLLFHLPKAILAVVTLVALKSMLLQIFDLIKFWKVSRLEALTWLVTFLAVVIVAIDLGLLIGIAFSFFIVMVRFVIPSSTLLGQLPSTDIYVDLIHFKKAKEVPGIKIYQYSCCLFFMNRDHFKESLLNKTLGMSSDDIIELVERRKKSRPLEDGRNDVHGNVLAHTIIIDCSTISYIDSSGIETLTEIIKLLKELNIYCFLASAPTQVLIMFERTNFLDNFANFCGLFPSIHDAVIRASSSQHVLMGP